MCYRAHSLSDISLPDDHFCLFPRRMNFDLDPKTLHRRIRMTFNLWKRLEKRNDVRLKFQRSSHIFTPEKSHVAKAQKYQNSYKLNSDKPLKIGLVDEIVKTAMIDRLENETYNPDQCPRLCGQVASEIRKKILKLNFERYKIIVAVTIIEKSSQSLEANVGFLWDANRDNYSTHTLETQTFFAFCLVTGTYYE